MKGRRLREVNAGHGCHFLIHVKTAAGHDLRLEAAAAIPAVVLTLAYDARRCNDARALFLGRRKRGTRYAAIPPGHVKG